jgi:hypothetical protein
MGDDQKCQNNSKLEKSTNLPNHPEWA